METEEQKSCEQRISEHMDSREKMFKEIFDRIDNGDDAAIEELDTSILSLDTKMVVRIQISWGGPADYVEVELSKDEHDRYTEISGVTYHFADWFDHAERPVQEEIFPALDRMANYFAELA